MAQDSAHAKVSLDITLTTIIAAIAAAFGAFAILKPKLAIAASMKRETGSVEPAFRFLYVIPQYVSAALIALLCLALIGAFTQSIDPQVLAQNRLLQRFASFFVLDNILWILFAGGLIGALVKINWLSWILLVLSRLASFLPIPSLQGAFGLGGQSAGWLQTLNICRALDSGQPLLLSREEIGRLAYQVVARLAQPNSGTSNFAAAPTDGSIQGRANIALFGCVLEAIHYTQRWSSPQWAEFYAGLAAINARTQLFEPTAIREMISSDDFVSRLRDELFAEMTSRRQPVPADKYLAAADALASIWLQLRRSGDSVLGLVPSWAPLIGGRLYWLDRRLSRLPMLNSDGMRPQLIKLLARWGTIPWAKTSVFIQPFAKKLGWFLLQETALRVFPEQKDVTFWGVGDVQLTRIACIEAFEKVAAIVRRRQSAEAKSVDQVYSTDWDLFAAADYCLWNMASEREEAGRADGWDAKKGWRWKLEGGRVSKL